MCRTALASVSGQQHECRMHSCENAWKFVSQFTLCADVSHGRRPSFTPSAPPQEAEKLYEYFCDQLYLNGVAKVETGSFGADMQVSLVNNGPVTMLLDTDIWERKH